MQRHSTGGRRFLVMRSRGKLQVQSRDSGIGCPICTVGSGGVFSDRRRRLSRPHSTTTAHGQVGVVSQPTNRVVSTLAIVVCRVALVSPSEEVA